MRAYPVVAAGRQHPLSRDDAPQTGSSRSVGEAEPLMRRGVAVLSAFSRATGHMHPNLRAGVGNYVGLLVAMGLGHSNVPQRLVEAGVDLSWLQPPAAE